MGIYLLIGIVIATIGVIVMIKDGFIEDLIEDRENILDWIRCGIASGIGIIISIIVWPLTIIAGIIEIIRDSKK